jgi:hypothetical protein
MPISPGGTAYDDNELDTLFQAVGFVVVQWALAEQSLELAIAILYQNLGGRSLAKRVPKMLEPKLVFVSNCLATNQTLAHLRLEADALVADFRRLSVRRHGLVHGAIASLSLTNGGFEFTKLDIENNIHVAKDFRLEGADFPGLAKELIDLGKNSAGFGHKLLTIASK